MKKNRLSPLRPWVAPSTPAWAEMIERQMASPMPMPEDLVVTNESNIRSASCAGIPLPLSRTSISCMSALLTALPLEHGVAILSEQGQIVASNARLAQVLRVDPAALLALIASRLVDYIDPVVEQLKDEVDERTEGGERQQSHICYVGNESMPITTELKIVLPEDDVPRGTWPVFRMMVSEGGSRYLWFRVNSHLRSLALSSLSLGGSS